jgi:hypothetical protein
MDHKEWDSDRNRSRRTHKGTAGVVFDIWLAGGESSLWSSFSRIVFSVVLMRLVAMFGGYICLF